MLPFDRKVFADLQYVQKTKKKETKQKRILASSDFFYPSSVFFRARITLVPHRRTLGLDPDFLKVSFIPPVPKKKEKKPKELFPDNLNYNGMRASIFFLSPPSFSKQSCLAP